MAGSYFLLGLGKGEKKYKCDTCNKSYKAKGALTRHVVYECNKFRQYECPKCARKYIRHDSLLRHVKFECTGKLRFFCDNCVYGAKRKAHLIHHLQTRHAFGIRKVKFSQNDGMFKCPKCDNNYLRRNSLHRHVIECDKGPRFFCTECDYRCKRKGHLKQHIQARHNTTLFVNDTLGKNQKDLKALCKCTKCLKTFTTRRGLNYHLKNVKCKEPVYACKLCDFYSKQSKLELDEHVKTVHNVIKPIETKKLAVVYVCEICGKVCKTKKGYLYHTKNVCNKEVSYSCPQCDFTGKNKPELKEHIKTHDSTVANTSCDESMIENPIELHECSNCNGYFTNEMDLEIHMTMCEDESGRRHDAAVEQDLPVTNAVQTNQEFFVPMENVKPVDEACKCVTCDKKFTTVKDFQGHACEKSFTSMPSQNNFSLKLDSSLENSVVETPMNDNVKPAKKSGSSKRRKIKMVTLAKKPESEANAEREEKVRHYCDQCDFSSKSRSHYHKHVTLKHNIRNVYEREIQN